MIARTEVTKLRDLARATSVFAGRHPQRSALVIMASIEHMGLSGRVFSTHAHSLDEVVNGVIKDMMGEDYVNQA